MQRIGISCAVLIGSVAIAFAAPAEDGGSAPTLDALFGDARTTIPLAAVAARVPLADGESFRVVEIGRDAHASHHAVAIREREIPHRHDRHDLLVVMLSGYGSMRLGDETRAVGEGSILYVPRGTPHAFSNHGDAPAIAYAVYLPAFDGSDRAPLDD